MLVKPSFQVGMTIYEHKSKAILITKKKKKIEGLCGNKKVFFFFNKQKRVKY